MLGLIVAMIGIYLADSLQMPILDGVASILIGVILATTAALLAIETKGLLIGEAASADVVDGVEKIVDFTHRQPYFERFADRLGLVMARAISTLANGQLR